MNVSDLSASVVALNEINKGINKLNCGAKNQFTNILKNSQEVAIDEIAKIDTSTKQFKVFWFSLFAKNNVRDKVANVQSTNQIQNKENPEEINKNKKWQGRINKAISDNANIKNAQNIEQNQSI